MSTVSGGDGAFHKVFSPENSEICQVESMENKRRVELKMEVKIVKGIFYVNYVKVFLVDIS